MRLTAARQPQSGEPGLPEPPSWPQVMFEVLYAEPSKNGLTRPRAVRGSGYPMVNMGELFAFDRIRNCEMELVPMTKSEVERFSVEPGDLLFARQSLVASGTGKCSLVMDCPSPTTFESHLIRVRLNPHVAEPLFYYYYFASPVGRANVRSLVMQVSAAGIRGSELARLHVPQPSVEDQRKIASILSAYDDLIENNLRRIKILEEMAQWLYKEWFVDFHFPGYENVKLVDSPLGMIPEGWETPPVGEELEVFGGGTPDTKVGAYWADGSINWYTPSDLTASASVFMEVSSRQITEDALRSSSAKLFPPFSVMMTSRATIGVVAINTTEAATNQGFVVCLPNERVPVSYLYHWFRGTRELFESMASGATFKELRRRTFREILILVPSAEVMADFVSACQPVMDLLLALQRQNDALRQTRDLLLPKLISGDIDVSEDAS